MEKDLFSFKNSDDIKNAFQAYNVDIPVSDNLDIFKRQVPVGSKTLLMPSPFSLWRGATAAPMEPRRI